MFFRPRRIIIDSLSLRDTMTERALSLYRGVETTVIDRALERLKTGDFGKDTLVLARNRGRFVKNFRAGAPEGECGEKYIAAVINCPFNCSYCYLQSYFNYRSVVIFTNEDDLLEELKETIRSNRRVRLTTGEFSDSLALEELTSTVRKLLPLFQQGGSVLEVRTKTSLAERVIGLFSRNETGGGRLMGGGNPKDSGLHPLPDKLKRNLIATWTLSPERAAAIEEPGTASLKERINALARTASAGIRVGIRFDPLIPFYFDESEYFEIVRDVSERVPAGMIDRIEMGVLRFPPPLLDILGAQKRAGNILKGEFIKGRDGKYVLVRPLRIRMYRSLASAIRYFMPETRIKMSMEPLDVVRDAGIVEK